MTMQPYENCKDIEINVDAKPRKPVEIFDADDKLQETKNLEKQGWIRKAEKNAKTQSE